MAIRDSRRNTLLGKDVPSWVGRRMQGFLLLGLALGCVPVDPLPTGVTFPFSISMIEPAENTFLPSGQTIGLQWVDEGMEPGATVFIEAISQDGGDEIKAVILEGRDAASDGAADTFDWNGRDKNNVPLPSRTYQILGILANPGGPQDLRPAAGQIVIPFSFVGIGAGGTGGILSNGSGAGPFLLQDNNADFVAGGVLAGNSVRVLGGSGSILGTYNVTGVTTTRLTLAADAGDSGGAADVRYLVRMGNAPLAEADGLVSIFWEDTEYASSSSIELEVDPDTDAGNDNESTIRSGINLGSDGIQDFFAWDGTDTDGARVAPGQYFVRAILNSGASNQQSYLADDRVTVSGVGPTLSLTQPATDTSPSAGGTVNIAWTDSDPDEDATITLLIDPDTDLADPTHGSGNEVTIETGISEDSNTDSFAWETAGFAAGTYTVVGRIVDGIGTTVTSSAPGRVTLLNSPPVLAYVRPEGTTASTSDNNGNGPFELTDSAANFSTTSLAVRNLVFSGNTVEIIDGTDVTPGNYAVDEDPAGATTLTLSTNPGDSDTNSDVEYRVTGDIQLQRGTNPVFDFKTHDPEEASSFNLFLDFDNDGANGNEIQILSNQPVPMNSAAQDDTFTWTGTQDINGATVDAGNYRLYAEVDDGNPGGRPVIEEFEGRIFLNTGAGQPTITLINPATPTTGVVGQRISIDWTDENTDGATTITLRYDDDALPNEIVETGAAETSIVTGLNADEDPGDPGVGGNPDHHPWDWHPTDITETAVGEGEYYVFSYIGNNGNPVTSPDMISVAPGRVTIINTPPELKFTTPGASNQEYPSPGGGNIAWNERDADSDAIKVDLWLVPDGTFAEDINTEIPIADNYSSGSPFAWNGQDRFGAPVETGQYALAAVLNDGQSDETTVVATGLVNFRPDATTAVINMASLFTDTTVNTDGSLNISWRDITVSGNEKVELYADDDQDNTDDLGTLIQGNLNAAQDGAQDTHTWDVDVAVGDYYIHARLRANLPGDIDADLSNGGGGGPFTLTDANASFVVAGVVAGTQVRILSGTGATAGVYTIAGGGVTATTLTFTTDAGDSAGAGDVSYSVGELDVSTSKGRVTVDSNAVTAFDFLTPTAIGVNVALGGGPVSINWDYTSPATGTVTLEADPDATGSNGNEFTILNNRPQAAAPTGSSDSLSWNLQDTTATALPTGEYLIRGVFLVTSPLNRTAAGPVRIRKTLTAPLVDFTSPTTNKSYGQGDDPAASSPISITWQIDDPSPLSTPFVDLWYDEQQSPESGTGVLAAGAALATLGGTAGAIAEGLDASVQTSFTWTPPQSITNTANKTFYIHIRVRDGILPADDDRATAVGKININN